MKVKMFFSIIASGLILVTRVVGHGYVRKWTMDGVEYQTYLPYSYPDFTVPPVGIARFLGNNIYPLEDPSSTSMTCNVGAYPAPKMANVTAGSVVQARWNEWPHRGPIYTYMAYCPNGRDCSDFLGTSGKHWFKIEEAGFVVYPGYESGLNWATQPFYDDDNRWNITIPKCIKNGPYLIRHETMAVHAAYQLGKAQFYPQCAQVWVSGGTGKLTPQKVAIPGDIKSTDPGVFFNSKLPVGSYNYTVPGSRPIVCPI